MARDGDPADEQENLGANTDEDGAGAADLAENLGANSGDDAVAAPDPKKQTPADAQTSAK